jgi:hypothetical protein
VSVGRFVTVGALPVVARGSGKAIVGNLLPATPFPFVSVFLAGEALRRGLAFSTKRFDSTAGVLVRLGAAEVRRFPADRAVVAVLSFFGVALRLVAFVFFDDFFCDFPGAFFPLTALLAAFLVFFARRLLVFARLFGADVLALPFDLPSFFLTAFFLAFATTISFCCSHQIIGG